VGETPRIEEGGKEQKKDFRRGHKHKTGTSVEGELKN